MHRLKLALMAAVISGFVPGQTAPQTKGKLDRIKLHGVALEGNLEGDPPDRDVSIYLPPSYQAGRARRYPVLYILHGFADGDDKWFGLVPHFVNVPAVMEAALEKGLAREMILVMPNAYTRYAGSFYGSSVATGDWETFVTHELVSYIDSHYRTLAARDSRGLAGHSMGGYGVIRLAMKHPEVYSSVYAMSACCLNQNEETAAAETVQKAEAVRSAEDFANADFATQGIIAHSAAWSANPKTPPYFDMPFKSRKPEPSVMAQWIANAPVPMLGQYAANLKRLRALALDIGLQDRVFLIAGNRLFDRLLTDFSVSHSFELYEGTHTSKIAERLGTKVLPYFTRNLSFEREKSR